MTTIVKILTISLLGIYYFFGGILISEFTEYFLPKYNEEKYISKNTFILLNELLFSFSIIVTFVYLLRYIIKKLPLPSDSIRGIKTNKLLEINGTVILAYALFFNMKNLKFKLIEFSKRIDNKIYKNKLYS